MSTIFNAKVFSVFHVYSVLDFKYLSSLYRSYLMVYTHFEVIT